MFYYPSTLTVGQIVELDERETRHAAGSRRLRIKEQVLLFDGKGMVASGEIAELGVQRGRLGVYIRSLEIVDRQQPLVHLACALPKGDRLTGLLDMATQLGMDRFVPLICRYSNTRVNNPPPPRWQRVCIEACKQSHQLYVPELSAPKSPTDIIEVKSESHLIWCADPAGEPLWNVLQDASKNWIPPQILTLMIGPEGGFSQEEVELFTKYDIKRVNLGSKILRIETAAVALLQSVNLLVTKSLETGI